MNAYFGTIAASLGAIGVAMGAFGAHALKGKADAKMLDIWHTATLYLLIHALALLLVYLLSQAREVSFSVTGSCFIAGTVFFSGSLYLLVLTGHKWLGAITPIGGTLFIVGWISLAIALFPRS